ncbi:MAG: hypothetical protein R3D62_10525 [Xanthobacteraceae bacterium]
MSPRCLLAQHFDRKVGVLERGLQMATEIFKASDAAGFGCAVLRQCEFRVGKIDIDGVQAAIECEIEGALHRVSPAPIVRRGVVGLVERVAERVAQWPPAAIQLGNRQETISVGSVRYREMTGRLNPLWPTRIAGRRPSVDGALIVLTA